MSLPGAERRGGSFAANLWFDFAFAVRIPPERGIVEDGGAESGPGGYEEGERSIFVIF
jgi:hypothetical protein